VLTSFELAVPIDWPARTMMSILGRIAPFFLKLSRINRLIRLRSVAFFKYFLDMAKPRRVIPAALGLHKIVKYLSLVLPAFSKTKV